MIKQTIQEQMKTAMRAKDAVGLETLRYILSVIRYSEIDKKRDLADEEAIDLLSKEVKKRNDAIIMFESSGRDEVVIEERKKLTYIMALLPKQLSSQEVESIIDQTIEQVSQKDFPTIMKELMPKVKGRADGKLVSDLVKQKLAQ